MPSHPRFTPTGSQTSDHAHGLKVKTHVKAGGYPPSPTAFPPGSS